MSASCLQSQTDSVSPIPTLQEGAVISALTPADLAAVSALHDDVFGPGRFTRTAYRVREGAPALSTACCKLEHTNRLIGAVQMTWVRVGASQNTGTLGMLLGPLAVSQAYANLGYGQALVAAAASKAQAHDAQYVILVGDLPYYEKTGFERVPPGTINLPGPVDRNRLLIRHLGTVEDPRVLGDLVAVTDPT